MYNMFSMRSDAITEKIFCIFHCDNSIVSVLSLVGFNKILSIIS